MLELQTSQGANSAASIQQPEESLEDPHNPTSTKKVKTDDI